MCESIEQNKRRVVDWGNIQWDVLEQHVRRLQERIIRVTRDTGFWNASPVRGNLHAGFLKEEGDGNILSLFNIWGCVNASVRVIIFRRKNNELF